MKQMPAANLGRIYAPWFLTAEFCFIMLKKEGRFIYFLQFPQVMDFDAVIVRYSEIGLKGQNRPLFEKKLMENIRDCLKKNGISGTASRAAGRIIVKTDDKAALNCLVRVFGIHSLSPARLVSVTGLEKEVKSQAKKELTPGKR